jgi:pimeloyl-ACP methyl ester carboxylesterase
MKKKAIRKKAIEFIKEKGAYTFLKTSIPGLFTQRYKDQYPEKVESLIEQAKRFSPEGLIQYYEAMIARPGRVQVLKQFKGPVLFIMGEHDMAVPFESSLQQSYLPQKSHVHILRQSAHMGMWEEPQKANAILLDFLTAL